MFTLAARLSLGEPGTSAVGGPRPFLLSRLRPYPGSPTLVPTRFDLDPVTQTAIGCDASGSALAGPGDGKHRRTNTGTQTNEATGNPNDGTGGSDSRPDQDSDQD
jgi:putative ATP-grasp target RiPP